MRIITWCLFFVMGACSATPTETVCQQYAREAAQRGEKICYTQIKEISDEATQALEAAKP